MNDLPEQSSNVDYGSDSDTSLNGRNEKEYDLPAIGSGLRLGRNVIASEGTNDANKMLPKVSASGEFFLFFFLIS